MPGGRRPGDHLDEAAVAGGVPPAAGVEPVAPGAGEVEQLPAGVVGVADQHPQALPAEQPEIAAATGEHGVAADVAGGDLRVEGAAHPDGRGEAAGVGDEGVAGAQDLPVRAEDGQLAGGRDDLAVRRAPGRRDPVGVVLGRARLGGQVEQREVVLGQGTHASTGAVASADAGPSPGCVVATSATGGAGVPRGRPPGRSRRGVRRRGRSPRGGPPPRGRRTRCGGRPPGSRSAGSSWTATSVCSCWSRSDGRSRSRPDHSVPVVVRETSWCASVAQPTPRPEDATTTHGTRSPGMFCRTASATPWSGGLDGGHVEVLADVVLVVGHRALGRERGVVGEHGVDAQPGARPRLTTSRSHDQVRSCSPRVRARA